MNLNLKDLVRSPNFARFKRFRKGELVYAVCTTARFSVGDELIQDTTELFEFPVPISDAGDGVFNAEEKAMTLMKYIRKALENAEGGDE